MLEQDDHFKHLYDNPTYVRPEGLPSLHWWPVSSIEQLVLELHLSGREVRILLYRGAWVRGLGRGSTQRCGPQFQKQLDRTFLVSSRNQVAIHSSLRCNSRRDRQRGLSALGLRTQISALVRQELNHPLRVAIERGAKQRGQACRGLDRIHVIPQLHRVFDHFHHSVLLLRRIGGVAFPAQANRRHQRGDPGRFQTPSPAL